ncbi:MAG: hypothetical protein VB934_03450 [Polyangiaceae bacterium]
MSRAIFIAVASVSLIACDCPTAPPSGAPSAVSGSTTPTASASTARPSLSATSPTAKGSGEAKEQPKREPYKGPTGTLSGTIRATGDPAPTVNHQYPKGCESAAGTYGKLFRTGQGGTLADALVAVTNYDGYVPPKSDAVAITIRNCTYSARTVALTDGQHIEIRNLDPITSYLPYLDGARATATNVAVPRGSAVKLYSRGRQRYWLRDQMGRNFMVANVFHLPYSTTAVTGLDGRYRIEGLPVGEVKVSVMLPATKNLKHISRKLTIKAGDNTLDLEFGFDAAKDSP